METIYNFSLQQSLLVVNPMLTTGLVKINNSVKGLVLYDITKKFNSKIDLGIVIVTIPNVAFLYYDIVDVDQVVITNKIKIEQAPLCFNQIKVDKVLTNVVNAIANGNNLVIVCQTGLVYQLTNLDDVINNNQIGKLEQIYDLTDFIGTIDGLEQKGILDMTIAADQRWFVAVVISSDDSNYKYSLNVYEISTDGNSTTVLQLNYKNNCNCKLLVVNNYLFITIGSGLTSIDSQNLDNLFGKVLRFDISIPAQAKPQNTNPFNLDSTIKGRAEIYAYGLNNPSSLSVDDKGRIFCTDSALTRECIKQIGKGGNYGWPFWDGSVATNQANKPSFIKPIFEYNHTTSIDSKVVSIVGGQLVKIDDYVYIFADISGRLYSILEDGENSWVQTWTADIDKLKYIKVISKDNKNRLYLIASDQLGAMAKAYFYSINNL